LQTRAVLEDFSIEHIVPYFQPIYELETNCVFRYECLSRLVTAKEQMYLPSEFLYIVGPAQTNARVTQRIFELSSAFCLPKKMNWSINLFQSDLENTRLLSWLEKLTLHTSKHLAGIEVSYDNVKDQAELLSEIVKRLPKLHITVDNVYECNENIYALIDAGIQAIKLRGELLEELNEINDKTDTLQALISCCKKHTCAVIAEHIENEDSLNAVKKAGIKYAQGFYLQPPFSSNAS